MSRGPGRWQRLILAEVERGRCFYLVDLLPITYTRADYNALHRASVQLEKADRITVWRFMCGWKKTAICPPGAPNPARESLSVGRLARCHPSNTYEPDHTEETTR